MDAVYPKRNSEQIDTKVIPYSLEAEQSVLGGLMLDNEAWDKIVDRLSVTDFYRHHHQIIYNAMFELFSSQQPFDVLTLSEALKERQQLQEAGGELYLFELAKNTPSAANIAAYADIVRRRSVLRQLIATANDIAESAFHPEGRDTSDLLDEAERKIFHIAERRAHQQGPQNVKEFLAKASERIDKLYESKSAITGLATGFDDLDKMTSGLQAADLIIIAARPSMGKTVLGMNIAEHVALETKKPVLIFSLEMPGEAIVIRMLSSLGRIEQQRLRTGQLTDDDWPRITSSMSQLSSVPIFIDDTPSLSPSEVRARARRLAREQGSLALIVVDYLQLMQVSGNTENRATEISEISRSLKALAKELDVPVIAISQLNRSLEQRNDKRPVMSDLRESGAIEQDADLIAFIYREEVYNPDSAEKGKAEIIIAKHRNGPIGKVTLTFNGKWVRFDNYASQQKYDYGTRMPHHRPPWDEPQY